MPRIDLHTHSIASHDGSITIEQYANALEGRLLSCVAITDHNRIDYALHCQQRLGADRVIVGEEIMTTEGEIIGLYLTKRIEPGQSLTASIAAIKAQGGIVYLPHPFETVRSGVQASDLQAVIDDIDIIETRNGRAVFQNKSSEALQWAATHDLPGCASSDAHRADALGKTYTNIDTMPQATSLARILRSATTTYRRPSPLDVLAPKFNRVQKKMGMLRND